MTVIAPSLTLQGDRIFPAVRLFKDSHKYRTVTDLTRAPDWLSQFHAPDQTTAAGMTTGAQWVYFELKNAAPGPRTIILEHIDVAMHHLVLHWREKGSSGPFQKLDYSLYDPRDHRPLPAIRASFPVTLDAGMQYEFLARLAFQDKGYPHADFLIWSPDSFHFQQLMQTSLWGIFFGVFLLTAFLSMLAWMIVRDISLVYYALYLIFNCYAFSNWAGYLQNFIVPNSFNWTHQTIPAGAMIGFGLMFSRSFLETRRYLPRFDIILRGLVVLAFGQILASLVHISIIDLGPTVMFMVETSFLSYPLLVIASVLRWRQGNEEARYFSLAWFLYAIGIATYPLRDMGLIDTTLTTYHLAIFGATLELSLLSFAFARRVYKVRIEKELLEKKYFLTLRDQNQRLEEQVEIRTQELQDARTRAEEEARTDELTTLPNRRHFLETSHRDFSKARRSNAAFCIIVFDIDLFKTLNDTYGHAAGDSVLKQIGQLLPQGLRSGDFAGRIGGEEFAICCPETRPEDATILARRLRDRIAQHDFGISDMDKPVTASFGIAAARPADSLEQIMHRADLALYSAKDAGRNRVITHPE